MRAFHFVLGAAGTLVAAGCAVGREPPAETPMAVVVAAGSTKEVDFGRELACQAGKEGEFCNTDRPPQVSPAIKVRLQAFEIDTHEVTNLQWAHCMAKGDCSKPRAFNIPGKNPIDDYFDEEGTSHPDEPVVNVTWEMADSYCKSHGKRLPTEAEWEAVARMSPSGTLYPWGDDPAGCAQKSVAIEACNSNHAIPQAVTGTMLDDTILVDGKTVNGMAGNVAEWVADAYMPFLGCANPDKPMDGLLSAAVSGNGDRIACVSAFDKCSDKSGSDFSQCASGLEGCQDCRDEADSTSAVAPECVGQCLATNSPLWVCKKPTAAVDSLQGTGNDDRSVRGGSFATTDLCEARSVDRIGRKLSKKEFRPFIGFRCARSL